MTRINTIDPRLLTDQHLMAEYRELPMVHASLSRSLSSNRGVDLPTIPKEYTLNAGHVRFFYNKGAWLRERWDSLVSELRIRGFQIDPTARKVDWNVFIDNNLNGDWEPDAKAHQINVERILARINSKRDWYKLDGDSLDEIMYDALIDSIEEYHGVTL